MFDLNQSITEWRRQMLAAGIKTPVPLEELESHLREEIEQQMKSGVSEQKAFEISARQIGQPGILKSEFQKNEKTSMKKLGIVAMLIGAVIILRILTARPDADHLRENEQLVWIVTGMAIGLFGLSAVVFIKMDDAKDVRGWKLVGIAYSIFAAWISIQGIFLFLTVPKYSAAVGMTGRILAFTALGVSFLSVFCWKIGCRILPIVRSRRTRTSIGVACCLLGPAAAALSVWFFIGAQVHFSVGIILVTWVWTAMAILGGVGYGLTEAARSQTTAVNL